MHWLPISGEDSQHFPLHLGIRVTKENNTVRYWMEQCFTFIEKVQSKISFSSGYQAPMASRSLPVANAEQVDYTRPSCAVVEETLSPPLGGQI